MNESWKDIAASAALLLVTLGLCLVAELLTPIKEVF